MAKKSMLEREKKREKMVAKYAKLRAELKQKAIMKLFPSCLPMLLRYVCTTVAK